MKKGLIITIAVVVLAILAAGGIAMLHMPSKSAGSAPSASSATTAGNAILVTKTSSGLGQYLATPNGQPLYTFNSDSKGVSNCTGSCLALWPAYQDKTGTKNLPAGVGTITRTDNGETQFTYNGLPLYTFASDTNGQVTGNGVQGFAVAKPATANATTTPTGPQSPAQTGGSSW